MEWFGGGANGITGERAVNTLFRDILMAAMASIAVVLVIVVFLINPPKKEEAEDSRTRGNIRVEVIWPNDVNVDIDTWGKAPDDVAVGYSNLNGRVFNLVRDDLGTHADLTNMNYEVMFSRGIPEGEYIINLHWYSNAQGASQVPVKVIITMRKDDSEGAKGSDIKVLTKTVTLTKPTEERTVLRFRVGPDMELDRDSFNDDFKAIRAASTAQPTSYSTSGYSGTGE